jgi:hypothetical protein
MGWQSYALQYETEEEYKKIISTIKDHNVYPNEYETGEELEQIYSCCNLKNKKKYVLCGHGGGRDDTVKYFRIKKVKVLKFSTEFHEELENESLWKEIKLD